MPIFTKYFEEITMCEDCKKLRKQGISFPRSVPEHSSVFLEQDIVVFNLFGQAMLASVGDSLLLTVVDDSVRPGFQDDVLYIHSRDKK